MLPVYLYLIFKKLILMLILQPFTNYKEIKNLQYNIILLPIYDKQLLQL